MNTLYLLRKVFHLKLIICLLLLSHSVNGMSYLEYFTSWLDLDTDDELQDTSTDATPASTAVKERLPGLNLTKFSVHSKHELEYENAGEASQEIDEYCTSTTSSLPTTAFTVTSTSTTKQTTDENTADTGLEIFENKKYIKNDARVLPYLLSFLKHKRPTVTNTIVAFSTIYETVYPSCLKLEQVTRVCEGELLTILPTRTAHVPHQKSAYEVDDMIKGSPLHNRPTTQLKMSNEHVTNIRTTSSLDYDFESSEPIDEIERTDTSLATPELDSKYSAEVDQSEEKFDPLDFLGHKYVFESKIAIPIATTVTTTDNSITATIIAINCVPRQYTHIAPCKPTLQFHEIPSFPIYFKP